jgi:hypothetical protein
MEQTPLGKAEWIVYGALFEKKKEAKLLFDGIVKNYNDAKQLVASQNQQQPFCTALCIKISGMWQGKQLCPIHEG